MLDRQVDCHGANFLVVDSNLCIEAYQFADLHTRQHAECTVIARKSVANCYMGYRAREAS